MNQSSNTPDEMLIRQLLEQWSMATRKGRREAILANHLQDVLIYDVLAPMKYKGVDEYRRSWDDWQPETTGEGKFDMEDLNVTAGADVAFAHGFIRCGGETSDGRAFEDLVRATFCLRKTERGWKVAHQHISKPIQIIES